MIIVNDIFVSKPGNASKLAKLFKEVMASDKNFIRVMTDMTGQYNRVIMVSQYENLSEYEAAFEAHKNPTPEMQESMAKMKGYTEMYLTGNREIYQVM